MSDDKAPPAGPRRLHPSSLVFSFGKTLRALILPAGFAFVSGAGSAWEGVLIVLAVLGAGYAIIRYVTLTWHLDETELVVKQGVFFKSERHVPYGRIQNLDLVQNPLHRAFGLAEVRIETASGTEPEAVLSVLGLDDVESIRTRVFRERQAGPDASAGALSPVADVEPGDIVVRVPPRRLVFLGIVMNRGLAVVGAGFAALYEFGVMETVFRRLGLETWFDSLVDAGWVGASLQLLLLALVGLVVIFSLSIAWSLIRFWDFTLRATGDDLQLSCGLLTRVTASIPSQRVQSLTIAETLLHRCFGLASIEAQTAGGADEKGMANLVRKRFVPVLPATDVPDTVTRAVPKIRIEAPEWRSISATAARRIRRRALIGTAILAVPLLVFAGAVALAAIIPSAGVAWWYGGAAARRARFARSTWGVVWQRGVFTRKTTLLPEDKVQTVRLVSSLFDRRHDHVTLLVDAAGGGRGSTEVRIRYLDGTVARALFGDLAEAAATTEYQVRPATV